MTSSMLILVLQVIVLLLMRSLHRDDAKLIILDSKIVTNVSICLDLVPGYNPFDIICVALSDFSNILSIYFLAVIIHFSKVSFHCGMLMSSKFPRPAINAMSQFLWIYSVFE